ncbi:redoxin family protein [Aeromicrobium sp. A1-2]|uniref:TlpA family protein disulfide reductase n=1 Tax=Aeromicrobium sp. A1-2 TaxID=2107713 RepID=UPI0013C2CE75|nr:redoxin family protein [Aeromicrobium sp. A1-2]
MKLKTIVGLLTALLALSGCAGSAGQTLPGASDSGAAAVSFSFTGESLDGATYDGRQLAAKPTVLWFWAPWCPTCRAQAGSVASLAKQYAGQVNIVGVGGLADQDDIRAFARQVVGPIHLIDEDGEIWRHFGVTAQSTYLIVDAQGRTVSSGFLDNVQLADLVAELVG